MTAPQHPQRCGTCECFEEVPQPRKYRCTWNCCFMHPADECICKPSHYKEASHSSSPAAAPVPVPTKPAPVPICDICKSGQEPFCIGCERLWKHDEQIRQQEAAEEREKVLDALTGKLINYFENEAEGYLRGLPLFSEVDAISPKRVMQWIESLRRVGEQHG